MAITNEASTQLARVLATPPKVNPVNEWLGKLRIHRFTFTQGAAAGDADSTARLVRLDAGSIRLILPLCRIAHSAFGASRTLDLGWEAYTNVDGSAVVADPDGLDVNQDVSGAGSYNPVGTVGEDETFLFRTRGGVVIAARCQGGTIPAGATLSGYLVSVNE